MVSEAQELSDTIERFGENLLAQMDEFERAFLRRCKLLIALNVAFTVAAVLHAVGVASLT